MAKSTIIGDIQRTGFLDKREAGTNSQIRTYSNGNAIWADAPTSPTFAADSITTSLIDNDIMTSIKGDAFTFDLTTYVGIDTIPNIVGVPARAQFYGFRKDGNSNLFLDTFDATEAIDVDVSGYLDYEITTSGITYDLNITSNATNLIAKLG